MRKTDVKILKDLKLNGRLNQSNKGTRMKGKDIHHTEEYIIFFLVSYFSPGKKGPIKRG